MTKPEQLSKKDKQSIRKWYSEGKTIPEIAKKLNISENRVVRNIPMKLLIKDI